MIEKIIKTIVLTTKIFTGLIEVTPNNTSATAILRTSNVNICS
jgi:hypothetical protein